MSIREIAEFFRCYGDYHVELRFLGGLRESVTVEELYQVFATRLREELRQEALQSKR